VRATGAGAAARWRWTSAGEASSWRQSCVSLSRSRAAVQAAAILVEGYMHTPEQRCRLYS
jgi:hypothetical protein